jgi:anti-anti-sigma regulatory factor
MALSPDGLHDLAVTGGRRCLSGQMKPRNPAAASRVNRMVARDGALRIDRAGNLLRLAGDIDEATHADLAAALDDVAGEPGDIHVDMAGVEFCGLAGLRAFVLLSQGRHPGHDHHHEGRVSLHHPPASVRALLQILGWDSAPGLIIEQSPDGLSRR